MQKNKNLTASLTSFIELPAGRAVLIKGPWGAGKTKYIKKFREERESEKEGTPKFIFISLNGVTSESQINDQIFQQVYPIFSNRYIGLLSAAAKSAAKVALKIDLDGNAGSGLVSVDTSLEKVSLKSLLPKLENAILIFDDLERCGMPLETIFGYMNIQAEHHGYRVIVMGNEDEIVHRLGEKAEDYFRIKEKLIGSTFSVETNAEEALETFREAIADRHSEAAQRILENEDLILRLFSEGGYWNLRSLQQAVNQFAFLYDLLTPKAQNEGDFISDFITVLFILTIEITKGKIRPDELLQLSQELTKEYGSKISDPKAVVPLMDLESKYSEFHFYGLFPGDNFWHSFFNTGSVDEETARQCIDNCRHFSHENLDPLVKLFHIEMIQNDKEFNEILQTVESKFMGRQYTKPDAIKMVCGLYLNLAKTELIEKSKEDIVALAKKIIDDLLRTGKIEREGENMYPGARDLYGNMVIPQYESPEFKEIRNYLKAAQDKQLANSFPRLGQELLDLMQNDPKGFWNRLSFNKGRDLEYKDIPILTAIMPKDFAIKFLEAANQDKETISYPLRDRYKSDYYNQKLLPELDWLVKVKKFLEDEKSGRGPLDRFHIRAFMNRTLDPCIKQLKAASEAGKKSNDDSPDESDED
ncbi:MAG: KAP family NTPase [Pseudobdellovibrionaceae bacterium]|nr:KAP family NTPase [Pseudobdellovibrionaceae bacterium]